MGSFHDRYFQALGTHEKDKLKKACELAYDIRKFEIELYWKRATYFWALQLIAFTAIGFALKDGQNKSFPLLLISESLGVVTALAGSLTARGSKFWQENWEGHVDLLEREIGVRLTQVIVCREEPQFSVSRVNAMLLRLLTAAWGAALLLGASAWIIGAIPSAARIPKWLWPVGGSLSIVTAVIAACCLMLKRTKTRFAGRIYSSEQNDWIEYPLVRPGLPSVIWRDPLSLRSLRIEELEATTPTKPDGPV